MDRAEEGVGVLEQQQAALTAEIEASIAALRAQFDDANPAVETIDVHPRKADVMVERVVLVWR